MFMAVTDFRCLKKKKKIWNLTIWFNFPHHTHPWEGLTNQIPHSLGTENSQVLGGGVDVEVSIWSVHYVGIKTSHILANLN